MDNALNLSKYWLEEVIIGLDLCPFARIPFKKGLIRLTVCELPDEEGQLAYFLEELEELHESMPEELSTSLIVYPYASNDFLEFNDFVTDLQELLEEADLASVFQLVAFHPKFVFEKTDFSERGNLVNRSPYPVIHILRSEEIARALKNPKDGEAISFNNDQKLNELSEEEVDRIFYYLKK